MKIEDLIKNGPKESTKNEMIRYIYLELGKFFRRDINFFYGTDEEKIKIYYAETNPRKIKQRDIICKSLGEIYIEAFRKAGIEAEIVTKSKGKSPVPHVDLIVEGDNGAKYYMNPLDDLYRIQLGLKTKTFATKTNKYENLDAMSDEEIKTIDNELGYTYKGMYMDEFFEMVRDSFMNKAKMKEFLRERGQDVKGKEGLSEILLETKLDFILEYINYNKELEGYIELSRYYRWIIHTLFTKTEQKNIKKHNLYRTKKDGSKEMIGALELKKKEGSAYYLISNQSNQYRKLAPQELIEFIENNGWTMMKEKVKIEEKDEIGLDR